MFKIERGSKMEKVVWALLSIGCILFGAVLVSLGEGRIAPPPGVEYDALDGLGQSVLGGLFILGGLALAVRVVYEMIMEYCVKKIV